VEEGEEGEGEEGEEEEAGSGQKTNIPRSLDSID
jgi:hypothetical protein